jgi:ferritin
MLSQELQKALNLQIAHEQANAHIYRAVACWFQKQCLFGFEKYFKKQVKEETEHAEKLIEYVEDRDGNVELMSLPAPKSDYANVAEAVKFVAALERKTTSLATALYEQALKANDHLTALSIQWLLTEQVEEEAWSTDLEDLVNTYGNDPAALLTLDAQWGAKT